MAKPNADVIACILADEGVDRADYLGVKIAETFDPHPSRLLRLERALQEIATGKIVGEPRNAQDTLAIVRQVAIEALSASAPSEENTSPTEERGNG